MKLGWFNVVVGCINLVFFLTNHYWWSLLIGIGCVSVGVLNIKWAKPKRR